VVDGLGKEILLEAPPQRIFSAGLVFDNILLSLVPPERVVAVTRFAADPKDSYVVDKLRDRLVIVAAVDAVLVVATQSAIVLVASGSNLDEVRHIEALGYKVYAFTSFGTEEDGLETARRSGEIAGFEAEAEALIAEFWRR